MQEAPRNAPPGTIPVDPEEGFGPHLTDAFLEAYGEDSVFVTATVDLLTWRFVRVLVKAGKLPEEFEPPQFGPPEMRRALAGLITKLSERGQDRPAVSLMRSAIGHEHPLAFQNVARAVLGEGVVASWLACLEREDYARAEALLEPH
ncbi:hypothetical protein GCM10027188_29700 [Lysobacter humi (ex Lee et al. 2017)]